MTVVNNVTIGYSARSEVLHPVSCCPVLRELHSELMCTVAIGAFLTRDSSASSSSGGIRLSGAPADAAGRKGDGEPPRPVPHAPSAATGREHRVPGTGEDHDVEGGDRDGERADRNE